MNEKLRNGKNPETENRLIANRIKGILLRRDVDITAPNGPVLDFEDPDRQITVALAAITKEWENDMMDELWFEVPSGLTFPYYCLKIEPITNKSRIEKTFTSVNGNQPYHVIGSNNKLYTTSNAYLFDSNGQSVKIEQIVSLQEEDESLDSYLEEYGYSNEEKNKLKRVDFVPTEGQRTFPLRSSADYEQVFYCLDKIDAEEYKEPKRL